MLAYGQTGSGKTYTMGTGFELAGQVDSDQMGIVPRAVRQLFNGINTRIEQAKEEGQTPPEFKVSAQFLELYNEEIIDLFDSSSLSNNIKMMGSVGGVGKRSSSANNQSGIRIHEDANGNIYTVRIFFLTSKVSYGIIIFVAPLEPYLTVFILRFLSIENLKTGAIYDLCKRELSGCLHAPFIVPTLAI